MKTIRFKSKEIQLVDSPLSLKILLTLLIVFSLAALVALWGVHFGLQREITNLRKEATTIVTENQKLQEKTDALGSVKSIEDISKEELHLVDPKTVIIDLQK